jgi:hypothetical protein
MQTKNMIAVAGMLLLGATSVVSAGGAEAYTAAKCNMCHAVASADIAATVKSDTMKGPDLGGYKYEGDSAELLSFLGQETTPDGVKHKKKWAGTQADLDAMLAWLGEQKKAE